MAAAPALPAMRPLDRRSAFSRFLTSSAFNSFCVNTLSDTDKALVLFCASAWRSALSAKDLQEMGVENVAEIDGGFTAWKKAGLPVD